MADTWPKQRSKQRLESKYRFRPVLVIAGYVLGSGIGRRMRKRVRAQMIFEYHILDNNKNLSKSIQ